MRFKPSLVSLGLLALACGAQAQDSSNQIFSFSGFGTLGYAITDSSDATYTTGTQRNGATKSGSFEPDSKVGLQINGKFSDTFSGTFQAFAKQDSLGNYGPSIEWAFMKAKLSNSLSARVGRMGGPFFMTSDFRNVGYTNLSVRTPVDVYALVPVRSFDGADLLYQGNFGDVTINGQLWGGTSTVVPSPDVKLKLNDVAGINLTAEIGSLTLRAGHVETTFDSEGTGLAGFNQIVGGLGQLGAVPGLGSLGVFAKDLGINGKKASFSGVGASFEMGQWVTSAEYVQRKSDSLYVSSMTAWYTTVGYRVNKFTPYVSLSARKQDSISKYTAPSTAGYPAQVQGTVAALVGAANVNLLGNTEQNTVAFGSRWDLGKSYALKGEWASITLPAGSTGTFRNIPGGSVKSDTTINVFSAAVDFVF